MDLWRGEISARKLLAYIDRLPSHSAFAEASAQDDEMAELFAGQESGPVSPRITEWTPERAELVKINEGIQTLAALVISAVGGKGQPPKPEPRPETALDRLKARVEDDAYNDLIALVEKSRTGEE